MRTKGSASFFEKKKQKTFVQGVERFRRLRPRNKNI